jgi:hypothetical protein
MLKLGKRKGWMPIHRQRIEMASVAPVYCGQNYPLLYTVNSQPTFWMLLQLQGTASRTPVYLYLHKRDMGLSFPEEQDGAERDAIHDFVFTLYYPRLWLTPVLTGPYL